MLTSPSKISLYVRPHESKSAKKVEIGMVNARVIIILAMCDNPRVTYWQSYLDHRGSLNGEYLAAFAECK